MKLLANENFPLKSVRILEQAGYDIKAVGIECFGITDKEVIEFANIEQRTILTFDRDYGELIFKKGMKPDNGVIYLRWDSFQPDEPAKYLIDLFSSGKLSFHGILTVISDSSIRQRKYL